MNKVTPFLMFNDQLEAAIAFYTATFPDSEIKTVARTGKDGPINSAEFVVGGQHFMGYNSNDGGHTSNSLRASRSLLTARIRMKLTNTGTNLSALAQPHRSADGLPTSSVSRGRLFRGVSWNSSAIRTLRRYRP
ncbi:MAG: VOC family protein [Planctomycetaceae bacterium]|nr:VOC family protein [Planctomycetaceae bacterium]